MSSEKNEILVFLTNHLDWGSPTIAALYKERWQIEAFFRALKQNLEIKTFVGISPNAVKIQVWTALIAMLILRYLQLLLFTHRDLWAWLHEPFGTSPFPCEQEQYALILA